MKTDIYTLYLVTDRFDYTDDEFFSIIEEACQAGVTLVQLREKKLRQITSFTWPKK